MKDWLSAKWNEFLVLLGLRISDDWILFKAFEKVTNKKQAQHAFALAVIIRLKFGTRPNKKTFENICKFADEQESMPALVEM